MTIGFFPRLALVLRQLSLVADHEDCPPKIKSLARELAVTVKGTEEAVARVRIAVCIDEAGNYVATGWTDAGDEAENQAEEFLEDPDGRDHVVWVEALVPLPREPETVEGEVAS